MQVNELNKGEKANYELDGTILTITVQEQSINIDLVSEQKDSRNTVDICLNKQGELINGVENWFVANVKVPAAEYEYQETGELSEDGELETEKVKKPINLDKVILELWELPSFITSKQNEEGEDN